MQTVIDPLDVFGPGGAFEGDGHLAVPHFFAKAGTFPKADEIRDTIKVYSKNLHILVMFTKCCKA